jgi:hypothetical protein
MTTHAPRLRVHERATDRRQPHRADTTPQRDGLRANGALVVAWAGLAVVIGAYAIVRGSVGALVLAAFVVWVLRVPWAAAWQTEDRDEPGDQPPISFIP